MSGFELNARDFGASGSEFEATGTVRAGSYDITVADVGDFQVGQSVSVTGCHLHYYGTVYSAAQPYLASSQRPLDGEVELCGLDGGRSWQTFIVHFERSSPVTFRWMAVDPAFQTAIRHDPVLSRSWEWQGTSLPIDGEWVPLASGVRMRFRKLDWVPGESISFHVRNRLLARIIGIDGKTLTLDRAANLDADAAVIRHHDQAALQAAVDRAISERKTLFIPAGRYRLSTGLWIRNASLRIEGAHRDHTVLDVSEDHTAVFWICGGKDVAIRNLGMVGHTGFLELPAHTSFQTATGYPFWPTANQQMEVKGCSAANVVSTEHLLFEDVNVTRMASEVFYLHGSDREGNPPYVQAPHQSMPELQKQYTKSCTYHRCRVTDCGFNAFNSNDRGENTSILHCHVERVANFCEHSGRFTRVIGNYVLDGCSISVHSGTVRGERALGPCQCIISDNVFEGGDFSGGIWIGNPASQVTIANNLFIGFSKESAITIQDGPNGCPVRSVNIVGNNIDLTRFDGNPDNERVGISISASNVIVANNHVYSRGLENEKVTGIQIGDHAINIHVHDNLVSNCHYGFRTGNRTYVRRADGGGEFEYIHTESEITEAVNSRAFRENGLPGSWDRVPVYRNWRLRWLSGSSTGQEAIIERYDSHDRTVWLKERANFCVGDRFAVYPDHANWRIHHNSFTDCQHPVALELFSQEGVYLESNQS